MSLAYLFDSNIQFQDKSGNNNVNGFLRVYIDNTDDRAVTYKDFNGTLNQADIRLDNNGRAVVIVDDSKTYRLEVYGTTGVLLWTLYPISPKATGINETLEALVAAVKSHTIAIEGLALGKKNKQLAKVISGTPTQTVKSITQNADGEISVEFEDIDFPYNINISSPDDSIEVGTPVVDPERKVETIPLSVKRPGLVKADSEDTEPGTLIDKMEVVDNVRDPEDPTDVPFLSLEVTTDGQGNRKVAINEDNLTTFADDISNAILDIADTLDSMDFDEVPHGSFGSSLNQSPGDGTTTSIQVSIFRPLETTVGDAIAWTKTTEIGGEDFGTVTLGPGTYIICSDITCQWVGVPAGTYLPQVGNVLGEPFDFSQQQELHRRMTNVVTVSTTTQFKMRISFDAATPVMGFWVNSAQIVKIAGGMSQTNVTHDSTLTGQGSVADPLGVNTQNVAQSTLAGNVAQAFDPNKIGGYKKFEKVVHDGVVYKAKADIAEGTPWDATDWQAINIASYNLKDYGNIADTEDLNDAKNPGIYYVENNTVNSPVSGSNSSGWLLVFGTSNTVDQIFIRIYNGEIYKRVFRNASWNDWSTTYVGYSYYKGAMPSTIDTNYTEGLWSVVKGAGVAISGTYPSDIDTTKAMHLLAEVGSISNAQNYVYQTLFDLDTKRYYYRTRISGAWSDWISIASESFCTKYTDDEILKATNEFVLVYPYSSEKKLFDTVGNEVSSNFYSYYYNVTEGDIVKVNLGVFSSANFSVVSLWKNGVFVKSLVNSPTATSEFVYKITEDVDTMIVSYFANATYKALTSTNYADVPKPNLLVLPNSLTHKGITFSVGADGKVTLTGTADAGAGSFFEMDVTLSRGQYILTGLPATSDRYNYMYRIIRADSSYDNAAYTEYNQGYIFEVTSSTELVKIYIHVKGAVALPEGGVVFAPMLQAYPPFTLGFVPYGQPAEVKNLYGLVNCSGFSWSGKKMNVIGDSIVEGKAGNWVTIIGNILHLSVARNYGIGGCRMSYYGDGGSVTPEQSVVARYSSMDDDADIVIVHAGTNDWASQVPLGNEDSQSNLEFNGALNIIMDGLRSKYPTALVIFSAILDRVDYDSPTHGGSSMPILTSAYSEAIKNQCRRHKMVFFDGYTYCGLDFTYDYSHGNFVTNDGLHPNVGGAKIIGRKLAGFINAH